MPVKIVLLVLFLAFLWGGGALSVKIALRDFAPLALAGLRFSIALLLIVCWARLCGIAIRPRTRDFPSLFLMGMLFASQIVCFNWGTNLTYAGRSAVMINTYPLFVGAVAHFLLPEDRLTGWKALGLILSFGGIVMVFWDNLVSRHQGHLIGDLLTLCSGFQLGLLSVLTKRLLRSIDVYQLLISQMTFGVVAFFVLSAIFEGRAGYGFSYPALIAVLYQGAVVGAFCFVVWMLVLKRYSASRMAVLFFSTPLWGITLSHFFLGEPITPGLGIGAVAVAFGICIVNLAPQSDVGIRR